jgi:hypothetical protein
MRVSLFRHLPNSCKRHNAALSLDVLKSAAPAKTDDQQPLALE